MKYLPSLRCLPQSLNAARNAFSDSFNSPDAVNLDPPIHNVGFCPFCFTSHFHCTRSSHINRRHVEHVTLIQSRRCRISTTFLRSVNPNSFRADWILCLHDSLVTMPFLFISLSGIGSLELRALVSRVSLQHCLSKSLRTLRRCLYCMAFQLHITGTCLISVPVTAWLCTGLTVLYIIPLHGSHCSSLIFGVRTWSLAVLRSLGSSCTPFIMLHFCHDSFSALCAVIHRCAPHQNRVGSLTTLSRPIFIDSHTCTDTDIA